MNQEETVKGIETLLNMLEGVQVMNTESSPNELSILLTIESHKSHLWLEYCADAANIPLRCWTKCHPGAEEAASNPALALEYMFKVNKNAGYIANFEHFNYLGSHLVWLMHYFGKIESKEANRLLDLWGSAHVEGRKRFTDSLNKKDA